MDRWVAQHAADARAAGKPLILEEMGKFGSGNGAAERDQYYQAIYDALLKVSGFQRSSCLGGWHVEVGAAACVRGVSGRGP